jgi:hypothetical protein
LLNFKTYIFEHPTDNEVTAITRRSYLFAGLFGAFYVLFSGFVARFFLALLVDAFFFLAALVAASVIAAHLSNLEASVILVFLVIAVMVLRARPMIAIVRSGYRRRGWSVTPI